MSVVALRPNESGLLSGRVDDALLVADLPGRYVLQQARRSAYCRAQRISQNGATLVGLGGGSAGDDVNLYFEDFGVLKGKIRRAIGAVLMVDFVINALERKALIRKIKWLQRSLAMGGVENRRSRRFHPREPNSKLLLFSEQVNECYVIDLSTTGAAIAADVLPDVGTPLAVGKVLGRVIRHTESGFAVHFLRPQGRDIVEQLICDTELQDKVARREIEFL